MRRGDYGFLVGLLSLVIAQGTDSYVLTVVWSALTVVWMAFAISWWWVDR